MTKPSARKSKKRKNYKVKKGSKTYNKRMAGPTHQRIKRKFGMKAFKSDGTIINKYQRMDKAEAKAKWKKNPTKSNLKAYRQATQSVNWDYKRK